MSASGICTNATPGSGSSATNQNVLPLNTDDANKWCPNPRVVKIPCKLMLDAILDDLGYPKARYDFNIDEHAKVSATVTFYSSAHTPGNLTHAIKIVGDATDDSEIAEQSAAREGIKYMEIWEGLEIEDLHYSELEYVRHVNMDVEDQLKAVQAEKDNLKKELLLTAKKMVSFSREISDLAANNRSFGQGDQSERINMTLELFEEMAANLGSVARHVQKKATDISSVGTTK